MYEYCVLYTCLKPEIMVQSFFYWFDRKWSLDLRFSSSQDIRRKAGEQNEPSNTVDDPGDGSNGNTQHSFSHVSLHTSCFLRACVLKFVLCSLQLALRAENSVGEMAYYDHYYVQVDIFLFSQRW